MDSMQTGSMLWKQRVKSFPASNQCFLEKRGAYHRAELVSLMNSTDKYRGSFKFDKKFLNKPNVKKAISQAWRNHFSSHQGSVSDKLRLCRKALSKWKKEHNTNSLDKINQIHITLERAQSASNPSIFQLHLLKKELVVAYREEEDYWSQRSRERWLKEGTIILSSSRPLSKLAKLERG